MRTSIAAVLALAFTLSCSGGDDSPPNSHHQGGLSSSSQDELSSPSQDDPSSSSQDEPSSASQGDPSSASQDEPSSSSQEIQSSTSQGEPSSSSQAAQSSSSQNTQSSSSNGGASSSSSSAKVSSSGNSSSSVSSSGSNAKYCRYKHRSGTIMCNEMSYVGSEADCRALTEGTVVPTCDFAARACCLEKEAFGFADIDAFCTSKGGTIRPIVDSTTVFNKDINDIRGKVLFGNSVGLTCFGKRYCCLENEYFEFANSDSVCTSAGGTIGSTCQKFEYSNWLDKLAPAGSLDNGGVGDRNDYELVWDAINDQTSDSDCGPYPGYTPPPKVPGPDELQGLEGGMREYYWNLGLAFGASSCVAIYRGYPVSDAPTVQDLLAICTTRDAWKHRVKIYANMLDCVMSMDPENCTLGTLDAPGTAKDGTPVWTSEAADGEKVRCGIQ